MKPVMMMAVKSNELYAILNGDATAILRTTFPENFNSNLKLYLYCTDGGHIIEKSEKGIQYMTVGTFAKKGTGEALNGTVCATTDVTRYHTVVSGEVPSDTLLNKLGKNKDEFIKISKGQESYILEVTNVNVLEKSMDISNFQACDSTYEDGVVGPCRILRGVPRIWGIVYLNETK